MLTTFLHLSSISYEVSPFLSVSQPAISFSYLSLPFFPSLECFPHMLNSAFLGFSHNFILCFVFSLPSPCFTSLMVRLSRWHLFLHPPGVDDGWRRHDSCLGCGCEHAGHVSGRDEALQMILSSSYLHLPSAEGMASFRKDSVLSPEFPPVETPEALDDS